MRMSCNGCRVLRKGCSDNCSIRPSLQWINTPDSQANATLFLAKFYGRAGLINLINAGPDHLRPAVFRSLLYEACGRIANPINGSVGLLGSGNWQLCQNAVEAVLKGNPITQIATDAAETNNGPQLKPYDIRHVSKDENSAGVRQLHRVRNRSRFKRSASKPNSSPVRAGSGDDSGHDEFNRSPSDESSLSQQSQEAANAEGERRETQSFASVDTAEAETPVPFGSTELEYAPKQSIEGNKPQDGEIELELTLGFEPVSRGRIVNNKKNDLRDGRAGVCEMELRLDYTG